MSTRLVSIIIPVFNDGKFLPAAVESALHQASKQLRVEIIIVDDGSTDCTHEIATRLSARHECIKMLAHPHNLGPAAARKTGIRNASGEWIAFIDADDTLPANALETLYASATAHPQADMIVGPHTINRNGIVKIVSAGFPDRDEISPDALLTAILDERTVPSTWAKLFHREVLNNDDVLSMPDALHENEDALMLMLALRHCRSVATSGNNNPVYNYNVRAGSIMHRCTMKAELWQTLFQEMERIVPPSPLFLHFKLNRLYVGAIARGVEMSRQMPMIRKLLAEAREMDVQGHDRLVVLMLRSRKLRQIIAFRHRHDRK